MNTRGGVTIAYEEERTEELQWLKEENRKSYGELRGWVETWERRNVFVVGELNGRVKIHFSRSRSNSIEPDFLIGISGFHI